MQAGRIPCSSSGAPSDRVMTREEAASLDRVRCDTQGKDVHRMPPTTEPLSRNFLDETLLWIIAAVQDREAMRTRTSPATRHGRSSNTQFRARGFAESMHHPLIRIVSLQSGSRRLRHLPTATRLAVRCVSFFLFLIGSPRNPDDIHRGTTIGGARGTGRVCEDLGNSGANRARWPPSPAGLCREFV
jgi:hypothetical protein